MSELEKIKLRLGVIDNTQDDLLSLLLEEATEEVLDFTNREVLLPRMNSIVIDVCVEKYNRLNCEGESSRSEGGISVSYFTNGLSDNIKNRLVMYRKNKVCSL